MPEFTVAQLLDAAEKNKYPNFNDKFIEYEGHKVTRACVIGEAFLNLGFTENGVTANHLSYLLQDIKPDNPDGVTIQTSGSYFDWFKGRFVKEPQTLTFENLSDFINTLNGYAGWRGKKRIVKAARKHFSKSLNQVITLE